MNLKQKILAVVVGPVFITGAILVAAFSYTAQQDKVREYVDKARAVVLSAESAREEMGVKWAQGIFTEQMLRDWAAEKQMDKVLAVVPVYTASQVAMRKAAEGGYQFRIPKFQPRNPKNEPDATEARVLEMFERQNISEHYEIDRERNTVRYFRPVRLTDDCLSCHGDPKTSMARWGRSDGTDPTGGPMEGWKVGEVHGAFEVVQSLDAADASRATMVLQFATVVFTCLLIGAGAAFYYSGRHIVRPLQEEFRALTEGSQQVLMAAGQVSASARSLSQGATEQAASLEETSASMEEMASVTHRNAEHTQRAAGLMADVEDCVGQSNRALGDMVASMGSIRESSQQVAKIIATIDEIAFQTNILALNAAVEAARAGEAGMGFAVVADEVRNLAQRSAQAARDTTALIETSIENSRNGNQRVEDVAQSIVAITGCVAQVKGLIDEISTASRQQAQGIEQVSQAVTQMEKVTQTTAATAEEGAAASEELHAQAETAIGIVLELETLVGRSTDTTAVATSLPARSTARTVPRPRAAAA